MNDFRIEDFVGGRKRLPFHGGELSFVVSKYFEANGRFVIITPDRLQLNFSGHKNFRFRIAGWRGRNSISCFASFTVIKTLDWREVGDNFILIGRGEETESVPMISFLSSFPITMIGTEIMSPS